MSQSSKAFEIGAHEGSPPADPEYDNDVVLISDVIVVDVGENDNDEDDYMTEQVCSP